MGIEVVNAMSRYLFFQLFLEVEWRNRIPAALLDLAVGARMHGNGANLEGLVGQTFRYNSQYFERFALSKRVP